MTSKQLEKRHESKFRKEPLSIAMIYEEINHQFIPGYRVLTKFAVVGITEGVNKMLYIIKTTMGKKYYARFVIRLH